MAELGDESVKLHERVGAHAAKRVDVLLVSGEYADALARGATGSEGFRRPKMIVTIEDNAQAARWLREHARRRRRGVAQRIAKVTSIEEIVEELGG